MDFLPGAAEVPMRASLVLLSCLVSSPARADYHVNLAGTATALAPSGETIQLTGGGSFDPDAQVVRMSGNFVVVGRDGAPVKRGTWRAHQLGRFSAWRGSHELGGVLEVMATVVSESGAIDQQRMRFVCTSNKPPTVG